MVPEILLHIKVSDPVALEAGVSAKEVNVPLLTAVSVALFNV